MGRQTMDGAAAEFTDFDAAGRVLRGDAFYGQ
jgi:hypothetical protein